MTDFFFAATEENATPPPLPLVSYVSYHILLRRLGKDGAWKVKAFCRFETLVMFKWAAKQMQEKIAL